MVMLPQSKDIKSDPVFLNTPKTLFSLFKAASTIPDFLETLYLFTANDFTTFALPTTLFATFGSLSGPLLLSNPSPYPLSLLLRVPFALATIWANLLIFNISNQRTETALQEDAINKPHRPLPSGRITCIGARRLLLVLIPLVLLVGWVTGTWQETLLLFAATWMYNDLGGSDESWIGRNLMIAVGYGLYSSAALRVMAGPDSHISTAGIQWLLIISAVMFTTQHICDIKDAEGDRLRGRRSAPIVLGDEVVRWSVAVPVVLSSVTCPAFFGLPLVGYVPTLGLGVLVAGRTLRCRSLEADKLTWKLWALWTCSLFALPLMKNPDVFVQVGMGLKGLVCGDGDCASTVSLGGISGVAVVVEGRRVLARMGESADNGTLGLPQLEGTLFV